jgi:glycine cleavage system aminomethyltransferase T
MPDSLLETPLASWHAAHGGRMVDFAGWTMPVQYASIVEEHLATRRAAGLFDVSHMGRLSVTGSESLGWLDSLLTRRVADLAPGQVRYTLVTSDEGPAGLAILDDALVAREAPGDRTLAIRHPLLTFAASTLSASVATVVPCARPSWTITRCVGTAPRSPK